MKSFIALLFFLIPLVWSKQVNANYLSAKTFFLYFTASLAMFTLPEELNFRRISRPLLILLGVTFAYYVGYFFFDFEIDNFYYIYKMLSFVFVTLFIYSSDLKMETLFAKTSYAFGAMWLAIVGITGYEFFTRRVIEGNIKTDILLSTFGNVNMFSEFAMLGLPILFFWGRHKADKIPLWIKQIIISFVVFYILYGRSRSALMGLVAWFVFKAVQGIKKSEWVSLSAALILFSISHFATPNSDEISKFVPTALHERSALYKGTLELMWNNPGGIRLGQFMNDIVPYLIGRGAGPNEFAYFDQPHSEYLKWGVQFGWGMLALALAITFVLGREVLRKYKEPPTGAETKETKGIFLECFIMFMPQALFQFPFENPASILLLGIIFGLFLSSYENSPIKISLKYLKYVIGTIAFTGIINAFIFASSIFLESQYAVSPDIMSVVCRIYPVNFRACYWKSKDLLTQKNFEAFKSEFRKEYPKNPFFCDNLRMLPEYFNYSQNERKTCEALILYRFIYARQTHFLPQSFEQCKKYSVPFEPANATEFNRKFREWFEAP